jgi:pimeloyl-ACP methyl ester carboxylesterase
MPLPVAILTAPDSESQPGSLCEPIIFDGCFGWYHRGSADLGVVLCGPHGYEELCVHRHWRELARDLSAHDLPTLRFDYPGTGDSTGDDEMPYRVQAWLDGIRAAIAALRRLSGVDRVALVGLRIGALLAAAAAEQEGELAALVLLAPPGSGKACIRELRALAMMQAPARHRDSAPHGQPGRLEAAGFVYTSETLADLAALSLLRSGDAPARNVLLLHRPNAVADKAFHERLLRCGAEVEEGVFQDYQVVIRDADSSAYPTVGFGRVVNWLAGLTGDFANPAPPMTAPAVLRLTGADERPVFFDRSPDLFGVMCEPHDSSPGPALVFLNTGLNHRIGTSRMTVTMARQLARLGFASLRLDTGGIGDSDAAPGRSANDPNDSAVADVSRALAWLESRGFDKVILVGLCSGAKLALETTLQDDRVVGQVLVNLGGFWKPPGATGEFGSRRIYFRLARQGSTWRRLLRGEIDIRGISKAFAARYAESVAHTVTESWGKLLRKDGTRGAALKPFQGLAARGVKTAFIYVEEDPGLDEMEVIFGRGAAMLRAVPNVSVQVTNESDHIFSRNIYRRHLFSLVERTLAAMVPAANAHPGARPTPCNSVTPVEL